MPEGTNSQHLKRALLLSDFTMGNLAGLARRDPVFADWDVHDAGFGQAWPALVDESHVVWQQQPEPWDLAVLWTLPGGAVPAFSEVIDGNQDAREQVLEQVDAFCDAVSGRASRARVTAVPTWTPPPGRGLGMLDWRPGAGIAELIARMNLRLSERLSERSDVFVLDVQRWITACGPGYWNPKLWFMGKVAFDNAVALEALQDLGALVEAVAGGARKLIVLDLDNTLWGGIVGDQGWSNLKLGGHDPTGEAFADFQRKLKALTRRGIVLAIASKNDEAVALEAIRNHSGMVLKLDDFAGWRINWNEKAGNIRELAAELKLGLQSVVFIDDNIVERSWVQEALPDVLVPDWPANPMQYADALAVLRCFDSPSLTAEDAKRSQMYSAQRDRKQAEMSAASFDDWLQALELTVEVAVVDDGNLARTVQLLNKTNQMNLATRRLTAQELLAWAEQPGRCLRVLSVADKFGDSGLTGILSLEIDGKEARIVDFVLSCRVMGRRIEETMLCIATRHAANAGAGRLVADYSATQKNRPCLEFFESRSDFTRDGDTFGWDLHTDYPPPGGVTIKGVTTDE